ncbi:hypothetical protein CWC14_16280 [Pseudoalteromonas sp. S3260]|nr:hypothetical protein CWC14_16280 [Pseudoalteromonas sp. S3260]
MEPQLFTDLTTLTSSKLAGRKTNSHSALLTREYLKARFKEHQLTVIEQPFTYPSGLFSKAQGVNIVATKTAKDTLENINTALYQEAVLLIEAFINQLLTNPEVFSPPLKAAT